MDRVHVDTRELLRWKSVHPGEKDWVISNLAQQQILCRTMTGLTNLTGLIRQKDGYYGLAEKPFEPRPAGRAFLQAYALGYKISRDPFLWRVARGVARGNDLGDIGESLESQSSLNMTTAVADPAALHGIIELYHATQRRSLFDLASRLGDNILGQRLMAVSFCQAGIIFMPISMPRNRCRSRIYMARWKRNPPWFQTISAVLEHSPANTVSMDTQSTRMFLTR